MDIDTAIAGFCEHLTRMAERSGNFFRVTFEVEKPGKVYTRVCRCERNRDTGELVSRSAAWFVERSTGLIWKPDGWKRPAKNFPRGNVYDSAFRESVAVAPADIPY